MAERDGFCVLINCHIVTVTVTGAAVWGVGIEVEGFLGGPEVGLAGSPQVSRCARHLFVRHEQPAVVGIGGHAETPAHVLEVFLRRHRHAPCFSFLRGGRDGAVFFRPRVQVERVAPSGEGQYDGLIVGFRGTSFGGVFGKGGDAEPDGVAVRASPARQVVLRARCRGKGNRPCYPYLLKQMSCIHFQFLRKKFF